MGRTSGTMPSMMGMMMLSRMIMYFCGDPDSWDLRSIMIGMMGGGMGGMGGMDDGWNGWWNDGWHGWWYAICSSFGTSLGIVKRRPNAKLTHAIGEHLVA